MEYFSYELAYRWAITRHKFTNNAQNERKHNNHANGGGGGISTATVRMEKRDAFRSKKSKWKNKTNIK